MEQVMTDEMSYEKAGVNVDVADETKREMAKTMETTNSRVLNKVGAFASLYDGRFPELSHPILVLKTEEPGSKQKLAFQNDRIESVCKDMISHLINDVIVMGATPMAVQDAIICGHLEKEKVLRIVKAITETCREYGCELTGGETSEQPGVLERDVYVLVASMVGVVDKSAIIDGSKISEGDVVLALLSSGPHTNGYSLIRRLLEETPAILAEKVEDKSFLDAVLIPHKCYYRELKGLFSNPALHGMAHITGGGIQGNLNRILPANLSAKIRLNKLIIPSVFNVIRKYGRVNDENMLKTFNMGAGMTIVVNRQGAEEVETHLRAQGCTCFEIGEIIKGDATVKFEGNLEWND
jgi:phosphoribosylformylglycinamidine cyclo-ligase